MMLYVCWLRRSSGLRFRIQWLFRLWLRNLILFRWFIHRRRWYTTLDYSWQLSLWLDRFTWCMLRLGLVVELCWVRAWNTIALALSLNSLYHFRMRKGSRVSLANNNRATRPSTSSILYVIGALNTTSTVTRLAGKSSPQSNVNKW